MSKKRKKWKGLFCPFRIYVILFVMRYLGIDYGEKRIGVAVSDPEGRIAFPRMKLRNRGNKHLWDQIREFLVKEKISKVVVGLPLGFDMSETEESRKVRKFVKEFKKRIALPVEFENEILTSHMAERAGIEKEHTDEAAAAIILQAYLDRINDRINR